jgi:ribosome-associated protein
MTDQKVTTKSQFSTSSSYKTADSKKLIKAITEGLFEKKARDIVLLDVRNLTTLADFFVVCHGTSDTQIRALANSVHEKVKEAIGENPWKKEGMDARSWVILDYVNIVVHIFSEEKREYYGIERMWNDAVVTEVADAK